MEALIYHLVRALVGRPEQVEITRVQHPAGDRLDVRVAQADFARVVGRNGRTARALRAVLASARHEGSPPLLNLVDPEENSGGHAPR